VLLISTVIALFGAAILANASLGFVQFKFPARWSTTLGVIVSVDIVERNLRSDKWWFPQIAYQYSVRGRSIVSTHVAYGTELHWRDRKDAEQFLEHYIARSHVLVYYNPNKITEAALEPSYVNLEPATWAGVAMILLGVCILIIYDRTA
jgi:hypothetical protein